MGAKGKEAKPRRMLRCALCNEPIAPGTEWKVNEFFHRACILALDTRSDGRSRPQPTRPADPNQMSLFTNNQEE